MTPDLVSTIIPVHNRPGLLREAVDSVLAQTYRPIEIVIVDDGSTDETPKAAAALAAAYPDLIRVIRQENAGPGAARETGRRAARGEFLQYLDSDDLLLPRKFELQVRGLRDHPECGISYGMAQIREIDGSTRAPSKDALIPRETLFPHILRARFWDTSAPLFRKSVSDAAGPWSNLRLEEDWEHDTRIAVFGVRLHYVPEFVSVSRNHPGPKLAVGAPRDPARLRERARSHALIYSHAKRAGFGPNVPEMQHFARALFLLSRQCGAAGLPAESRMLFDLAREASSPQRRKGIDFRLYRAAARVLGWTNAGRIAWALDVIRGGK